MIYVKIYSRDTMDRKRLLWVMEDYNQISGGNIFRWCVYDSQEMDRDTSCPDLIFFHTDHGEKLALLHEIRRRYEWAELVIISGQSQSAAQYIDPEIRPLLLLQEPLNQSDLMGQIAKLGQYICKKQERESFYHRFSFKEGKHRHIVPYSNIHYFEARNKKIVLYQDEEEMEFYDSFSRMEEHLPEYFVRCHRSYIVNILRTTEFDFANHQICLSDQRKIPISKKYRRQVEGVFMQMTEERGNGQPDR